MSAQYKLYPLFSRGWSARLLLASLLGWPGLLLTAAAAAEQALVFKSTEQRTSLLELYTSQGCYSCPPAENWLNKLVQHKRLWQGVVPLALHVDYWDYLGWKDPYGDKRNQQRHYAYKFQGLTRAIYTPEMILNGQDYTAWRQGKTPGFEPGPRVGELELQRRPDGQIRVLFQQSGNSGQALRAHVALLGFGIEAEIKAGENQGRLLHHEFVALAQQQKLAHPLGKLYQWRFEQLESEHSRRRSALVAWLDTEASNKPIQAVGGWID